MKMESSEQTHLMGKQIGIRRQSHNFGAVSLNFYSYPVAMQHGKHRLQKNMLSPVEKGVIQA
jgi:hypothetical protein